MVQKGMFSAGTLRFDSMLNVLLLPMLAIPRSPIFKDVPGRPSLIRFWIGALAAKLKKSLFLRIMENKCLLYLIGVGYLDI